MNSLIQESQHHISLTTIQVSNKNKVVILVRGDIVSRKRERKKSNFSLVVRENFSALNITVLNTYSLSKQSLTFKLNDEDLILIESGK